MPTAAATARAVASLSPVSSTGRRPSALSDATASADVGLTVSATTSSARTSPSQATSTAVRPSRSAACRAASSRRAPAGSTPPSARGGRPGRRGRRRCPRRRARRGWRSARPRGSASGSSARAAAAIARAIGCSEASSSAPASRRTSARSTPSASATSTRLMRPVVTVPVLSSTIVSTRRVDSRTSGPLISRPSWAPRPVPTSSAVGVARPSAHGQAMISTATAAVKANSADSPAPIQKPSVAAARPITIGTKMPETRSASRCTGALPDWASVTSRAIWASAVSVPTLVARTTRRPPALTVAPATSSPGCFSTGTDSPVSSDWSTALRALLDDRRRWRPSRRGGRRSDRRRRAARPGRAARSRRGRARRRPWRRARAAPSARRRRGAWRAPRSSGPASRNVVTTAPTSR